MQIERLSPDTIEAIIGCDGGNGWNNNRDHWAWVAGQAETGARTVLVARSAGEVIGYGSLLWQSAYLAFNDAGTPEIHDLATARSQRGRGVATRLVATFEQLAAQQGRRTIGMGVGLYADYGPAQRLYASLGYVPDGGGVTYRNQPVVPGASWPVDDDLVLWLSKALT